MSILLSAYFPEGIVFSADKNATVFYDTPHGEHQYVEVGSTTKAIAWPHRAAVVGFCGLGSLAELPMDDWIRCFIASTWQLDDIDDLAERLKEQLQQDFDADFPSDPLPRDAGLILHLGGFRHQGPAVVPVMYLITNVPGLEDGDYSDPRRQFEKSEEFQRRYVQPPWHSYPNDVRSGLSRAETENGCYMWFNNGLYYPAFNVFRAHLYTALAQVRSMGLLPSEPTLEMRAAFCEMSVKLFGSFFEHHYLPEHRGVGGGADTVVLPWPGQ